METETAKKITLESASKTWPTGRAGGIYGVTYDEIVAALGEPTGPTCNKVRACWQVTDVETGRRLSVWDYRSPYPLAFVDEWTYWGDTDLADDLLGRHNVVYGAVARPEMLKPRFTRAELEAAL